MKVKSLVIGAAALTLPVLTTATTYAGYAPANRATFTCASPTVCEGANYVTFNSFTNAPNYGDERAFFDAKDAGITTAGGYQDKMTVKNGQKIVMRAYIHNNADPSKIGTANAVAKNTALKVLIPSSKKTTQTAAAEISASNAQPGSVSDTVNMTGANPFSLEFDKTAPVQVTYKPNGQGAEVTRTLNGVTYTDANTMNANFGDWNGCFEYAALVTFTVTVKMDTPPTTPPTETPKTPTTTTPTTLPKTGPAEVVAAVAGVSVLGAIAHRLFTSRRLSRQ